MHLLFMVLLPALFSQPTPCLYSFPSEADIAVHCGIYSPDPNTVKHLKSIERMFHVFLIKTEVSSGHIVQFTCSVTHCLCKVRCCLFVRIRNDCGKWLYYKQKLNWVPITNKQWLLAFLSSAVKCGPSYLEWKTEKTESFWIVSRS